MKSTGKEQNTMLKLTTENTQRAIERCRQLKPKVTFIADRIFKVQSANNTNAYVVRFEVKGSEKYGECQCKASQKGLVCYHLIGAATANIYRQSLKRLAA